MLLNEACNPLETSVPLGTPDTLPFGVEAVASEPEGWGCEADSDVPDVTAVSGGSVGTPVSAVESSPPPDVKDVDPPLPVLPWDSLGGRPVDSW